MKALKVLSAASHVVYFSFILDFLDEMNIIGQLLKKEYCFIMEKKNLILRNWTFSS